MGASGAGSAPNQKKPKKGCVGARFFRRAWRSRGRSRRLKGWIFHPQGPPVSLGMPTVLTRGLPKKNQPGFGQNNHRANRAPGGYAIYSHCPPFSQGPIDQGQGHTCGCAGFCPRAGAIFSKKEGLKLCRFHQEKKQKTFFYPEIFV